MKFSIEMNVGLMENIYASRNGRKKIPISCTEREIHEFKQKYLKLLLLDSLLCSILLRYNIVVEPLVLFLLHLHLASMQYLYGLIVLYRKSTVWNADSIN